MNEWTVVTVLVTLVGLLAAVLRPILKLNTIVTRLDAIVSKLEKDISSLTDRNTDSHKNIWEKVNKHGEAIKNHETRIVVIENTVVRY